MSAPLYQFQWTVPDAGYEVVSTSEWLDQPYSPEKEERFLVEKLTGDDSWIKQYTPLISQTGLFREFADLHPATEESIVDFAGRFGSLGVPFSTTVGRGKPGDSEGMVLWPSQSHGELISSWQFQVKTMNHMLQIWDAIECGNLAALREFITWRDDSRVHYEGPLGLYVITSGDYREQFFGQLKIGELARPAADFVRERVNEKLENLGVTSRLLWEPRYRKQTVHVVPKTLAAAMWLQFAKAIEGNKRYQQCEQCNRWFEVAAEKREGAKFCQNACRSKAYREKQKTAKALRTQGLSVEQIAERVDSDAKTIEGWVKS